MDSVKSLFTVGIIIGAYFAIAIAYLFWAIASFQWWLLIVAVVWVVLALLYVRTAKKNFKVVQDALDMAKIDGIIQAYDTMYGTNIAERVSDEQDKA